MEVRLELVSPLCYRSLHAGNLTLYPLDSAMYVDLDDVLDGDPIEMDLMALEVPLPIWNALIPHNNISVRDLLLRYPPRSPPGAIGTIAFSSLEPTHLLSSHDITFSETIAGLLRHPLPSAASMTTIRIQSQGPGSSSHRSIVLGDGTAEAHFPTWMEKCITQMIAVESTVQRWSRATRWLRSPSSMADAGLTLECEQRLASTAWNVPVSMTRTALLTTPDLASLLGTAWLSEDHMNAGGEWINRQLGPNSPIRVLNTHFLGTLRHNRQRFRTWTPARPRELDGLIMNGAVTFLLVAVYQPEHWTYLHVNLADGSCVYIDTLDPENILVPDEVIEVLDWYLETVRPGLGALSEDLPTFEVDQQLDGHSCGPATLSTMAHVALGTELWTQASAPQHRKQWFIRFSAEFAAFSEVSCGILPART